VSCERKCKPTSCWLLVAGWARGIEERLEHNLSIKKYRYIVL
jgi:hypothetical protein